MSRSDLLGRIAVGATPDPNGIGLIRPLLHRIDVIDRPTVVIGPTRADHPGIESEPASAGHGLGPV